MAIGLVYYHELLGSDPLFEIRAVWTLRVKLGANFHLSLRKIASSVNSKISAIDEYGQDKCL